MGSALASACVVTAVFSISAQTSDQSIAFEAASVKVNVEATNSGGRESISDTSGRLTMRNIRLRSAIAWAYHLQTVRISGPPSLDSVRYDIDASSASAVDRGQHRTMLQELLKDRFKLAFHSDAQEMPAYVLSGAKGGLKLQESTADGERGIDVGGKALINLRGATMEQFAQSIIAPLHSPVVDATGLTGYTTSISTSRGTSRPGLWMIVSLTSHTYSRRECRSSLV